MKIYFDKTKLPKEVLNILKEKSSVYDHASELTKFVENSKELDINTLLCLANLELACAKATEFEEDMIDFGGNALNWLNKALETEPGDIEIRQDIAAIQKKIRKAERSANEILKYEKENLDEMPGIFYVKELAFYYYSRCRKSTEFANKGYKTYKYVYEKELRKAKPSAELLYYWHALTECKFEAEGYAGAELEIEKLISWDLTPQFSSYTGCVTDGYWLKLFHYSEINELESFGLLYDEWHKKMVPLEKHRKPYISNLAILNPISDWLLKNENTNRYLEYILENGYLFFSKNVLDQSHKDRMVLIKERLKKDEGFE